MGKVLTKEELAERLQVHPRTIERWIAERRVPFVRLPQRGSRTEYRFLEDEIEKWLHRNSISPVKLKDLSFPVALRKEEHET